MAGSRTRRGWGGTDPQRGARISDRIEELEITKVAVSDASGLNWHTINRYTKGFPFQNEDSAARLARALQWTLGELMGDEWVQTTGWTPGGEEPAARSLIELRLKRIEERIDELADSIGRRDEGTTSLREAVGALRDLSQETLTALRELQQEQEAAQFDADAAPRTRTPDVGGSPPAT